MVVNKDAKMAEETSSSSNDMIKAAEAYNLAYEGNVTDGAVLLGQSIGLFDSIEKVSIIIEKIVKDAETTIKKTTRMIE